MYEAPHETITTFDRLIKLTAVLVWPLLLAFFIIFYRTSINRIMQALVSLAERADEVKLWQLEIKRKIQEVAEETVSSNAPQSGSKIPGIQTIAAQEINQIVSTAPTARSRDILRRQVRKKMEALATRYERVRATMPSGQKRTSEMGRLTAQMRSLGLASKPFLREFTSSDDSPGKRLCAIAILQVSPSSDYLNWLFERYQLEVPFVFFQASIAILQSVRKYGPRRFNSLRKKIEASIQLLQSYTGGEPDKDTIEVLETALHELQQLRPRG